MHIAFADDDGAGGAQPAYDFGVFGGKAVLVDGAGGGDARAHGVDAVFDADGDAMQGAAQLAGGLLIGERLGLRERLFSHDGDPGVDFGVIGFDAVETRLGEIDGGDFLRTDAVGRLFESEGA